MTEAQIRAEETMVLGPEHAAEHAAERAAVAEGEAPLSGLSPSQRQRIARQDHRKAEQFAGSHEGTGPPSQVGRWTHAPFQIPHVAINAVMLPTGKVMFWGTSVPGRADQSRQCGAVGSVQGHRKQCVHGGPAARHRPGRVRPPGDRYGAAVLLRAVVARQRRGPDHRGQPRSFPTSTRTTDTPSSRDSTEPSPSTPGPRRGPNSPR